MNRDFALIDSNCARAVEGIRVLDEMARFVFRADNLFADLKELRHMTSALPALFGSARVLSARQGRDVGETSFVNASAGARGNSWDIIRANASRAAESLRVLQEFGALYAPVVASEAERARYRLYALELALLRRTPHFYLRELFEKGVVYPISGDITELLWLVDHGARIVQLRDKESDRKTVYAKTKQLLSALDERGKLSGPDRVLLIINDDPELAAALPVAGVHVGQEDGSVAEARRIVGSNKIIGRSNNSFEKLQESVAAGADYVSIGPVFATPTKPDRSPVGLGTVRQVAQAVRIPWLAIGGIDETTVRDVRAAGAKNVAVVRSACQFFS